MSTSSAAFHVSGSSRTARFRAFRRLLQELRRAREASGSRRITVRLARHTCGTLLALLKVHPEVAQAILLHSQISMTMDVHTHAVCNGERKP